MATPANHLMLELEGERQSARDAKQRLATIGEENSKLRRKATKQKAEAELMKNEVHKMETRWQHKYDKLAVDFSTLRKDVQAKGKEQQAVNHKSGSSSSRFHTEKPLVLPPATGNTPRPSADGDKKRRKAGAKGERRGKSPRPPAIHSHLEDLHGGAFVQRASGPVVSARTRWAGAESCG